ncbi:MAG TPA: glutathione S-transferase family protein [Caulobacteraceae bacterium]|nr:glutathione S-transferase family protein [Caulobacteraceae bacterium]
MSASARALVVYGSAGSGSVAVEAALTLLGAPYEVREGPAPDNPMAQVPSLILPSGEVMTESAAILVWLADSFPERRLGPAPASPRRPRFLRWMNFVSAAIYALYWVRDEPSRVVSDPTQEEIVKSRLHERIAACWRIMDGQTTPSPYLTGADLSVLDLYVTVVSRWSPGRAAFFAAAPRLAKVVRLVDEAPRLQALWADRFPLRTAER